VVCCAASLNPATVTTLTQLSASPCCLSTSLVSASSSPPLLQSANPLLEAADHLFLCQVTPPPPSSPPSPLTNKPSSPTTRPSSTPPTPTPTSPSSRPPIRNQSTGVYGLIQAARVNNGRGLQADGRVPHPNSTTSLRWWGRVENSRSGLSSTPWSANSPPSSTSAKNSRPSSPQYQLTVVEALNLFEVARQGHAQPQLTVGRVRLDCAAAAQ